MNNKRHLSLFRTAAFGYFAIPFLIFILGWTKWVIAVPVSLIVIICYVRAVINDSVSHTFNFDADMKEKVFFISIIVFLWVLFCGVGGYTYQTNDNPVRNGIYEVLVREKWPVIQDVEINGQTLSRGFSYYMGFWMVPALAAKIAGAVLGIEQGVRIGYLIQFFWAFLGVFLFYYGICLARKKIEVWPLIVFVFFSGMDIVGWYMRGSSFFKLTQEKHLEWWTSYQFSSNTTTLSWVYNQGVPAWLLTVLILLEKNNKHIFFLFALGLIECTLPCMGLIPIVLYLSFSQDYINKIPLKQRLGKWIRDCMTFENVIGGSLILLISCMYLFKSGNTAREWGKTLPRGGVAVWLHFLLLEIGGFYFITYRLQKKNILFHICMIWLFLCPILPVYGGNNFCMRSSVPALTLLYLFFVDAMEHYWRIRKKPMVFAIILVLCIGAVTPMHEFNRAMANTIKLHKKFEPVRRNAKIEQVMKNDYESTNVDENLFYLYIAR